jgi:hypothetical protein
MDLGLRSLVFARYQDKRWVPRDAKEKSSSRVNEEKGSVYRPGPGSSSWYGYRKNIEHSSEERNDAHPPRTNNRITTSKSSVPVAVEVSHQVGIVYFLFSILIEEIILHLEESYFILLYFATHSYTTYE